MTREKPAFFGPAGLILILMFGDVCESKLMVSDSSGDVSSFGDVLSSGGFMVGYQLFNVVYGLS